MISFIIINYNSQKETQDCISSLLKVDGSSSFEIIIVNNDAYFKFPLKDERIKFIQNKENIGFARAANLGALKSSKKFLCFINPDTKPLFSNIKKILIDAENDHKFGAATIRILDENGEGQKWSHGSAINPYNIIKNKLIRSKKSKKFLESKREVGWASGAFLIMKKDLFLELKGYDENFFMYFEDVDICKRIKDKGKKVYIYPEYEIIHYGGASFSNKNNQKKLYYKSQDYYIEKYFGKKWKIILKVLRKFYLR